MATTVEIIWDKHEQLIIRDVHEKWHDRVRNFMLENYFKPHRLFRQMEFQEDPEVINEYLKYVNHILKDECSIVVLHEETDEIYAVALVKCMTKDWLSWASLELCINQCKLTDYIELQYRMFNQSAARNPDDPFDSLHLFEYYIADTLRYDMLFMMKFFNAINETGRHMKMPRVTFLALSAMEQEECYEQGYEFISYAIYSVFTLHNRRPFAVLRDIDEMEAVLFQMELEPIIPFYEMIVRGIDDVIVPQVEKRQSVSTPKRTRSIVSVDE